MCGPATMLAAPRAGADGKADAAARAAAGCCLVPEDQEDSDCPEVVRSASAVPELLEQMNQSAEQTNKLELQVSQAQTRYRQRLAHWSRLHKDLLGEHGARAVDPARRFLEAEEARQAAAERIRGVLREIAAAASPAGAKAARGEEEHDDEVMAQHQREHEVALADFSEALRTVEYWRAKAGERTLSCILPSLRLLRGHAKRLDTEQERIAALSQRIRASKARYRHSMAELERISNAIHEARSQGDKKSEPEHGPASSGSGQEAYSLPPEVTPTGPSAPEVTPEAQEFVTCR